MRKPIRAAYVICNHKISFFCTRKENFIKSGSIVNIYIVYSLSEKTISSSNALKKCLFDATKVSKPGDTTDPNKYIYSGYGAGFDSTGSFTHADDGKDAKNVISFGAELSNSVHVTNKTQSVLVFGHVLIQKIKYTIIVIYLLMVKKSLNLKPKIVKLKQTN